MGYSPFKHEKGKLSLPSLASQTLPAYSHLGGWRGGSGTLSTLFLFREARQKMLCNGYVGVSHMAKMPAEHEEGLIEAAVIEAASVIGFSTLKDEQKFCICEFVKGRDVFAVLPTGFGKTI